jgi:hypothetical protein
MAGFVLRDAVYLADKHLAVEVKEGLKDLTFAACAIGLVGRRRRGGNRHGDTVIASSKHYVPAHDRPAVMLSVLTRTGSTRIAPAGLQGQGRRSVRSAFRRACRSGERQIAGSAFANVDRCKGAGFGDHHAAAPAWSSAVEQLDAKRKEHGPDYQDHGLLFCWEEGRPAPRHDHPTVQAAL